MVAEQRVLEVIQECFDSLERSGLLKGQSQVTPETILLGSGADLDSVAFVTFVSDFEDRIDRENGAPIYVVLSDIHQFNPSKSMLTAGTLARFIAAQAGQ